MGRDPVVREAAQSPRPYLAAGAAQLVTVADWVLPIDPTTWANHSAMDRSRDLRVVN